MSYSHSSKIVSCPESLAKFSVKGLTLVPFHNKPFCETQSVSASKWC